MFDTDIVQVNNKTTHKTVNNTQVDAVSGEIEKKFEQSKFATIKLGTRKHQTFFDDNQPYREYVEEAKDEAFEVPGKYIAHMMETVIPKYDIKVAVTVKQVLLGPDKTLIVEYIDGEQISRERSWK